MKLVSVTAKSYVHTLHLFAECHHIFSWQTVGRKHQFSQHFQLGQLHLSIFANQSVIGDIQILQRINLGYLSQIVITQIAVTCLQVSKF